MRRGERLEERGHKNGAKSGARPYAVPRPFNFSVRPERAEKFS